MEELLESLQNFNITNNKEEFDSNLDYVIQQFNKQDINSFDESDVEWKTIKNNYSKITFLDRLVKDHIYNVTINNYNNYNNYNTFNYDKFNLALDKFMGKIDTINKYYIENINWELSKQEFHNAHQLYELLKKSVMLTNNLEKLDTCLIAYQMFIPIIEQMRGEFGDYSKIEDCEFLKTFNSF